MQVFPRVQVPAEKSAGGYVKHAITIPQSCCNILISSKHRSVAWALEDLSGRASGGDKTDFRGYVLAKLVVE
jgi:hypothetical protein